MFKQPIGTRCWNFTISARPHFFGRLLLSCALLSSPSIAQTPITTTDVRPAMQAARMPAQSEVQLDGHLD